MTKNRFNRFNRFMGVVPVILICLLASVGVSHGHTAIVGATLMDGNGGPPIEDAVIVIEGRTISAVGRRGQVQVPADAYQIDAQGKYVIPGLMDAH